MKRMNTNITPNTPMHIAPYSVPNPIDTILRLEQRSCRHLPPRFFRMAEVFACLQTLHEAIEEGASNSRKRSLAAETWQDLAGELVAKLPVLTAFGEDPFRLARQDFPRLSGTAYPRQLPHELLALMAVAARSSINGSQQYTNNYHSVIAYQLARLGLILPLAFQALHRDQFHLHLPTEHGACGLVYPPDYSPDHLPHGSEDHFDLTDYEHPIHKKLKSRFL